MYRDIEILSLLPDRPGRGGTKFGYHSFQQEPINDTREIKNVHVWQDSWRSDRAGYSPPLWLQYPDQSSLTVGSETSALALHGYSKFSLGDPAAGPTTYVIGHNADPSYGGHIWNYSEFSNGTRDPGSGAWTGTTHVIAVASQTYPSVFLNIGNRCFIGRGDSEGIILDATQTDNFTIDGPAKVYAIGVGAPTAAPVVTSASVISTAAVYLRSGSEYLSWPDANGALGQVSTPGLGDIYGVTGDGLTWAPGSANDINIIDKTVLFTVSTKVSIPNGSDIATFDSAVLIPLDGNEWVGLTLTVNGFPFVIMAMGNAPAAGDPTLTNRQAKLATTYKNGKLPYDPGGGGTWDPANDIVSDDFTITGVRVTMQRGGINVSWPGGVTTGDPTIIGQFTDVGTSSGAGILTWDNTPPSYAYAWYDPVTGHISNISPVFAPQVTSQENVGVRINVDQGSVSYPPSTSSIGGTRWTHILFFRTLMAGGSTLFPIGSLAPTTLDVNGVETKNPDWRGLPNDIVTAIPPTTTGNYWYDTARDADLLISGALRAPQFTNNKPRIIQNGVETIITPAHMAYWDGRLWVAGPQDAAAIHYSCDRVQCPFGIPEESFADTNVLRIPADDGRICGMKLIGESLLVTTERWAYTIAGNNEANYRLVRISTRMAGVGDYQMDEFVSDVEGGGALVVFIGTDARIYAMPLAGQAVSISKEIQTYLDSAILHYRNRYSLSRVHVMSVAGRRLVLVYIPRSDLGPGKTFFYDFDHKVWSEVTLANDNGTTSTGYQAAWATMPSLYENSIETYAIPNTDITPPISPYPLMKVKTWLAGGDAPMPSGYVRTFPLNFDGKKTRKRVHFVRLYVNDQSFTSVNMETGVTTYGWRVTVRKDSDATGTTVTPLNEYDAAYRTFPVGSVPVDASTVAELIATDAALTPDTPLIGYRFDVTVTFPGQTNKLYQLYKVEIGWSTVSEGQVDP